MSKNEIGEQFFLSESTNFRRGEKNMLSLFFLIEVEKGKNLQKFTIFLFVSISIQAGSRNAMRSSLSEKEIVYKLSTIKYYAGLVKRFNIRLGSGKFLII